MKQEYLMGMSTSQGFKTSFYSEYADYYGYYLKGGPGTGKSTLMKRLMSEFPNEKISVYYCSSDPNSLDAVVFEDRKIFVSDATAPHESDTKLPYVTGEIVNLAEGLKMDKLIQNKDVKNISKRNADCHNLSKKYLLTIEQMQNNILSVGGESIDFDALKSLEEDLKTKVFEDACGNESCERVRQRHALTPFGKMCILPDSCRIIVLTDNYLYGALNLVARLKDYALSKGIGVEKSLSYAQTAYPCTMMYIPSQNVALCAEQNLPGNIIERATIVDLSSLYRASKSSEAFVAGCTEEIKSAESSVCTALSQALKIHDELEAPYIDCIDKAWLEDKYEVLSRQISTFVR